MKWIIPLTPEVAERFVAGTLFPLEWSRPANHPLRSVLCCKKCKAPGVLLPDYPGDYFDCAKCGHSWKPTEKQKAKMMKGTHA